MKETQVPLTVWLTRKDFKERYASDKGGIQLLFYQKLQEIRASNRTPYRIHSVHNIIECRALYFDLSRILHFFSLRMRIYIRFCLKGSEVDTAHTLAVSPPKFLSHSNSYTRRSQLRKLASRSQSPASQCTSTFCQQRSLSLILMVNRSLLTVVRCQPCKQFEFDLFKDRL